MLTAIAIPVFTQQLEKSREATDLSNIRSIYAEAALVVINGTTTNLGTSAVTGGAITASKADTGVWTVTVAGFKAHQEVAGWIIDVSDVAGADISSYKPTKTTTGTGQGIVFTIDATGKCTGVTAGT